MGIELYDEAENQISSSSTNGIIDLSLESDVSDDDAEIATVIPDLTYHDALAGIDMAMAFLKSTQGTSKVIQNIISARIGLFS